MMDPRTKLCFGCGRTLPEIARWHRMETAERLAVMEGLAARMAEAGLCRCRRASARLIRGNPGTNRRRRAVIRIMLVLAMLAATAGAVVAYGDPDQIVRASNSVTKMLRQRSLEPAPAVQIARGKAGEFALHAKINGVKAPMVIDTGATSVVLTWETAKAIGLPIEMLEYNVDVETAGGHTKAARLTLDRLAVGGLVEKSIPALVVPRGQMKTNLLGMSFLDRLESWGVQADKVMLHGYPDVAGRHKRRAAAN
jgi:clan AA aspartic protease (TIGR02281 family)